ncbi:unnamed protein product [Soboliphyme baturini]|uniref:BSD domain-containing protein n=1 Tax=Soboliphyme baturini TaxID=241478 RepID=A0A183IC16_9BILA|nr:unnamed protein product [Soboliphyme baturini]
MEHSADEVRPGGQDRLGNEEHVSEKSSLDSVSDSLSSWLQWTKEKTKTTLQSVKRDIDELSSTVQEGASNIVSTTSSVLREHAPQITRESATSWVKSLVDTVNSALLLEDTTKDEKKYEVAVTSVSDDGDDRRNQPLNGGDELQLLLLAAEDDVDTYLHVVDGPQELFTEWASKFSMTDAQLRKVVESRPKLKQYYSTLVLDEPATVSERDFFLRYYYKMHQIRSAYKKKPLVNGSNNDAVTSTKPQTQTCAEHSPEETLSSSEGFDEYDRLNEIRNDGSTSASPEDHSNGISVTENDDTVIVSKRDGSETDKGEVTTKK